MTVKEILAAANELTPSERAELIDALWNSISPEEWTPPSNDWVEEAQRRSDALDRGDMKTLPWSEVRQRARREAGLDG